jgi:hypothetical protein
MSISEIQAMMRIKIWTTKQESRLKPAQQQRDKKTMLLLTPSLTTLAMLKSCKRNSGTQSSEKANSEQSRLYWSKKQMLWSFSPLVAESRFATNS